MNIIYHIIDGKTKEEQYLETFLKNEFTLIELSYTQFFNLPSEQMNMSAIIVHHNDNSHKIEDLILHLRNTLSYKTVPVFVMGDEFTLRDEFDRYIYPISENISPIRLIFKIKKILKVTRTKLVNMKYEVAILCHDKEIVHSVQQSLKLCPEVNQTYLLTQENLLNNITYYHLFIIHYEAEVTIEQVKTIRKNNPESIIIIILDDTPDEEPMRLINMERIDYIIKNDIHIKLRIRIHLHFNYYKQIQVLKQKLVKTAEDKEFAHDLQQEWIPRDFPENNYFNSAGVYIPVEELSGDFYDYHRLSDSEYYFLISDVSGHGISSALIAAMQKILFNNFFPQALKTSEIIHKINNMISEVLSNKGYFFTAVCAFFDFENKKLLYTSAAHNDFLVIHPDRSYELIPGGKRDQMIGVFSGLTFHQLSYDLQSGDRVIFYTDGIIELGDKTDKMYGLERLIDLMLLEKVTGPFDTINRLITDLNLFKTEKTDWEDDITIIIIDIK